MTTDGPSAATMADRLALDTGPGDVFTSRSPTEERHVFGGLLVGQALRAAQLTVDGRGAHSLHASFVQAGVGGEHVRYEVERTRDGASFGTRRVVARQSRGIVLVLTADFHRDEDGHDYTTPPAGEVPGPDGLEVGRYTSTWFESRDVPPETRVTARAMATASKIAPPQATIAGSRAAVPTPTMTTPAMAR